MIKQILVVTAFVVAAGLSYTYVFDRGAKSIQVKWDTQEKLRDAEVNRLNGEIDSLVATHQKKEKALTDELASANASYENELSRISRDYAGRLQQSDYRAGVYKRKATGSDLEREDLARHAAELDRSLEEGRSLVAELGATIRQRDTTIKSLGSVILNDRTLLEQNHE